jgi:hypothetical protein
LQTGGGRLLRRERMRRRVVKTTGGGGCATTKDNTKRGEWEADTQVGSWQTREAEEDSYDTFTKQAVECVFDQICSFGFYVIIYIMFLCFQVHFRTKQTKRFLAYVMLNIICFYVFMFSGMLQYWGIYTYGILCTRAMLSQFRLKPTMNSEAWVVTDFSVTVVQIKKTLTKKRSYIRLCV